MFPRGPKGLANTAFWVGGSNVREGEAVSDAAQKLFFDPFKASIMHDSDGCNTTAAAAVVKVRGAIDLKGAKTAVIGAGPGGLRTAGPLRRGGGRGTGPSIPPPRRAGATRRAARVRASRGN